VPEPTDPDLARLRALYDAVPRHVDIKYKIVPGVRFLHALREVAGRYSAQQLAAALGVTPTTVYAMQRMRLTTSPRPWPNQTQMRRINRAWTRARGRSRYTAEFAEMHAALRELLEKGFDFVVIARRMGVHSGDLNRFRKPAISGADLMKAEQLAHQVGGRAGRGTPGADGQRVPSREPEGR
jgi:hypothetical protein